MATRANSSDFPSRDAISIQPNALLEVVRSLYAELHRTQSDIPTVDLDSALERDLGFDSLSRAELLLRIEQRFGVDLPDATLGLVETVADLLRLVTAAAAVKAAPGELRSAEPAIAHGIPSRPQLGVPVRATTLNEVLEWRFQAHPDAIHAIVLGEAQPQSVSYAHLRDGARNIAGALMREGVQPGSTVALMLPTGIDYFHAFFGVLLAGAIPVPIYPPTRPSQLEEHVQRHAGVLTNAHAEVLITFQEARGVARLLRARIPSLRLVLSIGELTGSGRFWSTLRGPTADSIAMLQYTSGSTGAPKGVVLTHGNLMANIRAMGKVVGAADSDVFVSWLPLYHDMGLIGAWLGSLYFGCLLVIMPPTSFLARPARWLRAIHEYRATLSASPNFGYELCARRLKDDDLTGLDLSSWRIAFNGAEPVSVDTLERFGQRFAPYGFRREAMTPVYGLAEAAVGLTFPPMGRGPNVGCVDREKMMTFGEAVPVAAERPDALRFVSCGQPLPGYQVRIVDRSESEVPERIEGNIQFSGPSATVGYYHNADATAHLRHGGWLDTGDRGYMANGELYVTGRIKDIIIRRGRHIYPDEIEEAVGDLEGVRKGCIAAFGTKDPATATERLVVLAETRYTDSTLLSGLKARINERVVDSIGEPPEEIVLAPPHTVLKTSSGKLRRAATRAAYEDGTLGRGPASAVVQFLRLGLGSCRPILRRLRQSTGRLGYGLYVTLVLILTAMPVGLLCLTFPRRQQVWRATHHAAKGFIRACGIPFSVTWQAEVDLSKPHVVVTNHCSYADSLFLAALLPTPHVFVAKAELQRAPLLGTWLRRLGTVFIERFEPVQSVAGVDRLKRELLSGNSIIMFPEGTFTRVSGLRPFHLGAFQVAVAAGVCVIPVTLHGTRSALRDGQWLLRRTPVSATIGRSLTTPAGLEAFSAAVQLRDACRQQILLACGEPDLQ